MPKNPPLRPSRRTILAGLAATAAAPRLAAQPVMPPRPVLPLVLQPGRLPLRPGAPDTALLTVGGSFPAPVLRARRGIAVDLLVENRLGQPTAIGVHGMRTGPGAEAMPGLNAAPIQPGETRALHIETPDAGTYIYKAILPGRSAEQTERGLAGVFIVEEANPPPVDHDIVAALDDLKLDEKGILAPDFNAKLDAARAGRLGNVLLINGRPAPDLLTVRPGARIRLRLANLANARIMPMKFEGLAASVVALDGQPCDPFDPLKRTVVLLPGSRYEVMLDAPATPGLEGRVLVALGTGLVVLRVVTEGEPLAVRPPIQPLAMNDLPPSIRLQNAARAELTIAGGLERPSVPGVPVPTPADAEKKFPKDTRIWTLNGGLSNGFAGRPLLSVRRGHPVVIAITNRSHWSQVLTVRGHVFRLLHPLDDGWEPYFMDTLHLPENSVSRIAFDAGLPGKWAIHSTIAEHFDAGLMTWFEVLP